MMHNVSRNYGCHAWVEYGMVLPLNNGDGLKHEFVHVYMMIIFVEMTDVSLEVWWKMTTNCSIRIVIELNVVASL